MRAKVAMMAMLVAATGVGAQSVQTGALQEVVVTARKQVENLQDVPVSVVAISAEQIERRNVNNLADLEKLAPGFTWSEGLSPLDIRPAIRGQANIRAASQPTVGVFVDGNNVPWRSGLNLQTVDVARVEVVKGPQSALFGRGVLSGAVNYVTKRPEPQFGGYAEALWGSDGRADLRGRLDLPASDTLAFAVAARWSEFDGFFRNNLTGRDGVGAEDASGGSVAMLFEPSESFSAYLRASYSSEWQAQPAWHVVPSNTQTGPMGTQVWFVGKVPVDPALIAHNCDDCAGTDRDVTWVTLNLDWQLGGGTLTSMTAYNQTDLYYDGDIDFSGLSEANLPIGFLRNNLRQTIERDIRSIGQELRFASDQERAVRWLAGAYYYDEKVDELGQSITGTVLTPSQVPTTPQTNKVTSTSVFGALYVDVTPRLTATAELRWNEDDATTDFIFSGAPRQLSNTWEAWLPRVSLDFKWTPDVMLYASAAQGTKPGGFNTALGAGSVQLPANLLPYDEEEAWSYEIGVKSTLLDRRLVLNAAVFRIDWKSIQVDSQFIPPPPAVGTVGYTSNAGKAEIEGAELELRWQVSDQLSIAGAYAYAPARIFDYQDTRATAAGIVTLGKRQLPYSSDSTATASVLYEAPLGNDWRGYAQLDGVMRSSQYASVANLAETGDRTVADLRLGIVTDTWEIAGFVTNLFDDDTAINVSPFVNVQTFGRNFIVAVPDPRQWGVRVRYSF
ncbi:MAG TPA: TonB-dependent receptor [Steroidobacteraceae bacterium]|mgnify:CR=1 FL=1|nr:TonB-dependent receptor [Steroidobacteraceae bacterium]HRX88888.1 TonB-dependent receptor [Steroidobacteraceae bacterium]